MSEANDGMNLSKLKMAPEPRETIYCLAALEQHSVEVNNSVMRPEAERHAIWRRCRIEDCHSNAVNGDWTVDKLHEIAYILQKYIVL
jgi:hypothetical protein